MTSIYCMYVSDIHMMYSTYHAEYGINYRTECGTKATFAKSQRGIYKICIKWTFIRSHKNTVYSYIKFVNVIFYNIKWAYSPTF